ncbi:RES family NAD+ phosphorylase [Bradyrhizobium sp.]|uniref:RES family NAD+ phosphorylase n=1 Tax=Bradyrhizobium sp. TaxID=376 RepID=UPI003C76A8BD
MSTGGRVHERSVLDALEKLDPEPFDSDVWRVARKGRDPLRGSSANGRWGAPGELEVLYTSEQRDGALTEVGFRLSLEPVWPSLIQHQIHILAVKTERTLRLVDMRELANLGVDTSRYETFEYGATQAIAAAAHFLEFDGLLVPSARFACSNLVLFTDRVSHTGHLQLVNSEDVDWPEWRRKNRRA